MGNSDYLSYEQAKQVARDLRDGKTVGPTTLQMLGIFLLGDDDGIFKDLGLFPIHEDTLRKLNTSEKELKNMRP